MSGILLELSLATLTDTLAVHYHSTYVLRPGACIAYWTTHWYRKGLIC